MTHISSCYPIIMILFCKIITIQADVVICGICGHVSDLNWCMGMLSFHKKTLQNTFTGNYTFDTHNIDTCINSDGIFS